MPKIKAKFTMNYEQQGSGEPLILIPYLGADHACYAFQVAEFSKRFTCISIDLRGTGESDNPQGAYSTETLADDIVDFMGAMGIQSAHMFGLSLGGAVAMWVAAKYPDKVRSLSLHDTWTKTDPFVRTVVKGWQVTARALDNVAETLISGIFPWCLTPELYAAKPEYIEGLAQFVRSRPVQSVESFLRQCDAVIGHDIEEQLGRIVAPTQITYGKYDLVTSGRFAERMKREIRNSEVFVFEGCAHAPIYEKVEQFNRKTLEFLQGRAASRAA
jgi:pimeloyl-ACP methyl ester carboxylesterase